jgi:hypothetical protein
MIRRIQSGRSGQLPIGERFRERLQRPRIAFFRSILMKSGSQIAKGEMFREKVCRTATTWRAAQARLIIGPSRDDHPGVARSLDAERDWSARARIDWLDKRCSMATPARVVPR